MNRKDEKENSVLSNLIRCANALYNLNLDATDRPDRKTSERVAVENGCDAILSGLSYPLAVQIAEVPLTIDAYTENARLDLLRAGLNPLLLQEFPFDAVDVDIKSESLPPTFDPFLLCDEIMAVLRSMPRMAGIHRLRKKDFSLPSGTKISANRHASDYPCPAVRCFLSDKSDFNSSFERNIRNKCGQFRRYEKSHILCVVLWSEEFMYLNTEKIIDAFRSADVDLNHIDSVWFIENFRIPLAYPLFSRNMDCRNDSSYLQDYLSWPPLDGDQPIPKLAHTFGDSPVALEKTSRSIG